MPKGQFSLIKSEVGKITNYNVFNQSNGPLFTQLTNTFSAPGIEASAESGAAAAGSFFALTTNNAGLPNNQNLLLQIINAAGSGRTLRISSVSGGTTAAATLVVYSGGTVSTSGGSTPVPVNTLLGSTNASVVTTRQNTGTLGGAFTSLLSLPLTAGMFRMNFNGSIIVPPGLTLSVSVGVGNQTAAINLFWWEF
ncbi:hypothetical protein [Paenibacillus xylanilyticus]|uniref:hypothetical protein n=1 Tax=Paenibacillus xylanilyticus TaxID=248903 RepID=UPI00129E70C9|nr:hypothetical protein [Paenibacillus xylanilyticus]